MEHTGAPPSDFLTLLGNLLAFPFFGFLLFAFIHTRYDLRVMRTLRERGLRTNAQVMRLEHRMMKDDMGGPPSHIYLVTYQFKANSETYSRRRSVERALYETLREGEQVEVAFLPEKPKWSWVAGAL